MVENKNTFVNLGRANMSEKSDTRRTARLSALALSFVMAGTVLSSCTTIEKGWSSTKNAVTGLFGDDDPKAPPPPDDESADASSGAGETASSSAADSSAPMTGGLFMGSNSASGAFRSSSDSAPPPLSSVPTEAPKPPSSKEERKEAIEGLIADREKAEYAEQGGRREPVTVRPLNEGAQTAESLPPRPQAAPVDSVTRLENVPAASGDTAAPRTTALAERLGAAPPPPPPGESAPAMTMSAPAAPTPVAPAAPAPMQTAAVPPPAMTQSVTQPLIPAPRSYIAGYGDDTVLVDSSGVSGGRNVLGQQLAGLPRSGFDPGNASVSSQVGTISFGSGSAALTVQAKAMLTDIARLRSQMDGAIRVVGRGDQAVARARAISKELRRLGVPASRLYDGGADNTQLGDEADIYLDY